MSLSDEICGSKAVGNFTSKENPNLLDVIMVENVKEKIQDAQKELKEELNPLDSEKEDFSHLTIKEINKVIDKVFLKHFGRELI